MEEIQKIELETPPKFNLGKFPRFCRSRALWLLLLLPLLLVTSIAVSSYFVFKQTKVVYEQVLSLKVVAKTKDLKAVKEEIIFTRESLSGLENSLKPLNWVGFLPFLGAYQKDALHLVRAGEASLEAAEIVVAAVEPYADIIGLSGTQAGGGAETSADRIDFLASTLEKVTPQIGEIGQKLAVSKTEVDQINPNRYPEKFRNQEIRKPLSQLITLVDQVSTLTSDARPVLEKTPWLLGIDAPRRYLIIFQNDSEIRPTGGFMTAYALLEVNKGKLKPLLSEDIYTVDSKFKPDQKAPQALIDYIAFPYGQDPRWRLRDMNISPDFKVSMETFIPNFQKVSKEEFDGVVSIDTRVLVRLLEVLGPVGVPEWGNFSAVPDKRCDGCPQVVYELERLITKPTSEIRLTRKAVIGPLMHSVLSNAFGSPKEKLPSLFTASFNSLIEKDILFYFPSGEVQKAMEAFNLAGRIRDFEGDFFHWNDSNFGGAKANLFINQKVTQEITVDKDGQIIKEVSVEFKNPSPHSVGCDAESGGLCLNAPYRDWFRLYVPKGSQLIESLGSEVEIKTYEELGKTVFEGYFGQKAPLNPNGGYTKMVFKYKLPFKAEKGQYHLLIQKQPGSHNPQYVLTWGGKEEEFELKTDKEFRLKL